MEGFFSTGRRVKEQEEKKVVPPKKLVATERPKKMVEKIKVVKREIQHPEVEYQKSYPERTFDKFVAKGARLRAEDIDLLKVFCAEISRAKRLLPNENREIKRITDNTALRLLLQIFCEKIEDKIETIDFRSLQTEQGLKEFMQETLSL
ncbi:MAG: hypothetical protein HOE90_04885 [Bacteriovoracaceae bacterium]|jgi:hypothetical protein|nr:hypothetical protein [Bacteriovoracaceae bacterium]